MLEIHKVAFKYKPMTLFFLQISYQQSNLLLSQSESKKLGQGMAIKDGAHASMK